MQPKKRRRPILTEQDLHGWQVVRIFQAELSRVLDARQDDSIPASERDPRRTLAAMDYFSLLLFALYNPVVGTLRGLCEATELARVREDICEAKISLSSFSEAQHLFDPDCARALIASLSGRALAVSGDQRLRALTRELVAVDGTLFSTLPRMSWAARMDYVKRGAKLHVKFSVLRNAVVDCQLTPGATCERAVLRSMFKSDELYVGDGYYGHDYAIFGQIQQARSDFVLRLCDNAAYTVEEQLPLRQQDLDAGILWDGWVRLGAQGARIRLVRVRAHDTELLLATNRGDLEADLIGLIYRHRWQIELFFKWIKCIVGCRHLLLESPRGVASQVYCVCILALLLTIATGRRPSKRQWERMQFHLMGWATTAELVDALTVENKKN